jgi:DnaK suppressor protein
LTTGGKTVDYVPLIEKIYISFSEREEPPMATAKSKKKKSGSAKKPVPTLKKKAVKRPAKKAVQKKVLRKKGKPMVKAVKPAEGLAVPKAKDEKEETRKTLLEMREKLLSGISENPIPEALISQSDIGDLIDQAGDERDRELSLLLSSRDKEKLLAINEALEKLKDSTYGECEECGEQIGRGRLKVMPLARFCVSCQAKLEKEMTLQKREEEDLNLRALAYSSGTEEEEA